MLAYMTLKDGLLVDIEAEGTRLTIATGRTTDVKERTIVLVLDKHETAVLIRHLNVMYDAMVR